MEPLLVVAKPYVGKSLKYVATDSWELGGTNWTRAFREEFKRRRGYDPVPYLPVVAGRILGSREISTQFLTDLRRTVGDLVNTHYDRMAERAKAFGPVSYTHLDVYKRQARLWTQAERTSQTRGLQSPMTPRIS